MVVLFFLYFSFFALFSSYMILLGICGLDNKLALLFLGKVPVDGIDITNLSLALFCILGAILGGSILNITSFHKYLAIQKNLDKDHFFGFFITPILSIVIGIISFSFTKIGLFLFSSIDESNAPFIFISIGVIVGYNWDVFIKKLNNLSSSLDNKKPNIDNKDAEVTTTKD